MIEYSIAEKKHLEQILQLYKQLRPDEDPLIIDKAAKIWEKIEQNNIKYFIAGENSKIIASCYICIIPNLTRNGKSIGFIENVVTDKEYRRKGIGKKIMENAVKYAREQNCYKVSLQSGNKRIDAHGFYESLGFDGNSKRAYEKIL